MYDAKTTFEVARSIAIFRACTFKPLVNNIDTTLGLANKMLGTTLVTAVLRRTFFGHFCAGEDQEDIRPCIKDLRKNGIGGILDYAAEADLESAPETIAVKYDGIDSARVFDYEGERVCDENEKIFLECIKAVHNVSPEGFAAIKVREWRRYTPPLNPCKKAPPPKAPPKERETCDLRFTFARPCLLGFMIRLLGDLLFSVAKYVHWQPTNILRTFFHRVYSRELRPLRPDIVTRTHLLASPTLQY